MLEEREIAFLDKSLIGYAIPNDAKKPQ